MAHQSHFIGKRYEYLVIQSVAKYQGTCLHVMVKCDCGVLFSAILENIERGKIISCGCIKDKNSPLFAEKVRKRIESMIEVDQDCWIWGGLYRDAYYKAPYVNVCGIQINPVKYFSADDWRKPNRNILYVRQCHNDLCVNPTHHARVTRNNLHKAKNREIKCEYLERS